MGDKEGNIKKAIALLNEEEDCRVLSVSRLHITKPVGPVIQDDFLNGALYMKTLKTPQELLALAGTIENRLGRVRDVRWGPRTIDLDILLYDDCVMQSDILTIPHPEMDKRLFVLEPMAEIAPWVKHPVYGRTMKEMYESMYFIHPGQAD